jgi:hypothetical protein
MVDVHNNSIQFQTPVTKHDNHNSNSKRANNTEYELALLSPASAIRKLAQSEVHTSYFTILMRSWGGHYVLMYYSCQGS